MEAGSADGFGSDHRAAFRDAALQLWADAGWAAVTVPAVSAATGLTEADFAAGYASPEDLLGEVLDEGTEERTALVLRAMEAAPGTGSRGSGPVSTPSPASSSATRARSSRWPRRSAARPCAGAGGPRPRASPR